MQATQAISLAVGWITSRGLDYPTEGLEAERFDGGWCVYAPVEVDDSDPMAFLDAPVGRSVFLVGDSGRIKEVSSSVPPRYAESQFAAEERAIQETRDGPDEAEFRSKFEPPKAGSERRMDPRRIELSRRHSYEMGLLFSQFVDVHGAMAPDATWVAYSADIVARHQVERSALAAEIAAERSRSGDR